MSTLDRQRPGHMDRGEGNGLAGSRTAPHPTSPPRRRRVTYRCTRGHVIEAGHLPTTCPAYVGGRPCDGELARW